MLFALLKIIHMFALYVGGAAGIGNGLMTAKILKSDQPPPPYVGQVLGIIGKMGFVAIILLWVTGIGMVALSGGAASLTWAFWVKLVGATLVLIAASTMSFMAFKAEKAGTPPDLKKMKSISRLAHVGLPLAVIFAVIAFAYRPTSFAIFCAELIFQTRAVTVGGSGFLLGLAGAVESLARPLADGQFLIT